MNPPLIPGDQSARPALELISLARMAPESAKQSLRTLLIADPGYFSRITDDAFKAVLRIQQDTTYECIGYVAHSQSFEQLQATIKLNQSIGYSDDHCLSMEYARFYLSYDGGFSWLDQGMASAGVQNRRRPRPQHETMAVNINPAPRVCVHDRMLVVRVILSWNAPPPEDKPEWVPVWGDIFNAVIDLDHMDGQPLFRSQNGPEDWESDLSVC